MRFSLIVCTYMRPQALLTLLQSVSAQSLYPDEILIIDGSIDDATQVIFEQPLFKHLRYYKVEDKDRGLTKQRNYGINQVGDAIDVVCFLDDDTVLEPNYFEEVLNTFSKYPEVIGVGGVAVNENNWKEKQPNVTYNQYRYYQFDNYVVKEGLRNVARNYLGLQSPLLPGILPDFSHGRTCGYPLTGQSYEVDLLIGMSMAFRKSLFTHINFSKYFEGYGLYEDADFSLRALQYGKNRINTAARLAHYHDASGRPNQFKYGKMVLRNGWYVWRVKNPNPNLKARLKFHATSLLLTLIRLTNIVTTKERQKALTESLGRVVGWFSIIFNPPKQI